MQPSTPSQAFQKTKTTKTQNTSPFFLFPDTHIYALYVKTREKTKHHLWDKLADPVFVFFRKQGTWWLQEYVSSGAFHSSDTKIISRSSTGHLQIIYTTFPQFMIQFFKADIVDRSSVPDPVWSTHSSSYCRVGPPLESERYTNSSMSPAGLDLSVLRRSCTASHGGRQVRLTVIGERVFHNFQSLEIIGEM